MRVLLILENFYPNIGGVETLFRGLVNGLADRGIQVTVLTTRHSNQPPSVEETARITIRRYRFMNRYFFTILAFFPAFMLARKHDLIQTTSYNAAIPAFLAGFFSGKKTVITFHEFWGKLWFTLPFFNRITRLGHYLFEQLIVRLPFHKFVAISDFTSSTLQAAGVPKRRITRIYNGIDYEKMNSFPEKPGKEREAPFTFIYFGRLGISKGLDVLIKAATRLDHKNNSFRLQLIIPKKPEFLRSRIKKMGAPLEEMGILQYFHELEEEVLFDKIRSSDCVVIPSYSEGFCFTAVESVALGVPVISSHEGALPEVIGGRFITYTHPNPEALEQSMVDAMHGRWQVREKPVFPLEETVNQYIRLYRDIVEG